MPLVRLTDPAELRHILALQGDPWSSGVRGTFCSGQRAGSHPISHRACPTHHAPTSRGEDWHFARPASPRPRLATVYQDWRLAADPVCRNFFLSTSPQGPAMASGMRLTPAYLSTGTTCRRRPRSAPSPVATPVRGHRPGFHFGQGADLDEPTPPWVKQSVVLRYISSPRRGLGSSSSPTTAPRLPCRDNFLTQAGRTSALGKTYHNGELTLLAAPELEDDPRLRRPGR